MKSAEKKEVQEAAITNPAKADGVAAESEDVTEVEGEIAAQVEKELEQVPAEVEVVLPEEGKAQEAVAVPAVEEEEQEKQEEDYHLSSPSKSPRKGPAFPPAWQNKRLAEFSKWLDDHAILPRTRGNALPPEISWRSLNELRF